MSRTSQRILQMLGNELESMVKWRMIVHSSAKVVSDRVRKLEIAFALTR